MQFMGKEVMAKKMRWVVKVGSNMVAAGGPILLRSWMEQVVTLKREYNIEVIWVSSGAISSAVHRTDFKKTKADWQLSEKQALSAIGQPILMDLYNLALHAAGLLGAQVLLTAEDIENKSRLANLRATIEQLLKWKVIPILNENDATATEEITFGDNDSLSAKVAGALGAQRLIILTDVDGLFENDPRAHSDAKLISRIKSIDKKLIKAAGTGTGSKHGTGGMLSKVNAAKEAAKKKVETVLVKGDVPSILIKVASQNFIGTVFEVK